MYRSSIYKDSIGNRPHNLRIPYTAGSGVVSTSFATRRHRNIYANGVAPYTPTGEQVNAIWPAAFGFDRTNQNLSPFLAPLSNLEATFLNALDNYAETESFYAPISTPIISSSNIIYMLYAFIRVEVDQSIMYAYNTAGEILWNYVFMENDYFITPSSPILGDDGNLYVVTQYAIYSLTQNGNLNWRFIDNDNQFATGAVFMNGGILLSQVSNRLLLLNTLGEITWTVTMMDYCKITQIPTVDSSENAYVVYGNEFGYVDKYEPNRGQLLWRYSNENVTFDTAGVLNTDKSVLLTSVTIEGTTFIVGLNTTDGTLIWAIDEGPHVSGYALLQFTNFFFYNLASNLSLDSLDNIYMIVEGEDNLVVAFNLNTFDPNSNESLWTYSLNSVADFASTPIIDADQNLILTINAADGCYLAVINGGNLIWPQILATENNVNVIISPPTLAPDNTIYVNSFSFSDDVSGAMVVYANLFSVEGSAWMGTGIPDWP